jgi:quercetin dioxygenase-like cupin family protein
VEYARIYADEAGETHYQDAFVEQSSRDFAPPAPPFFVSTAQPATGALFVRFPAGWQGDWHPTPRRQFFVFLAGAFEGEVSDGERRRHHPGDVVLLDDITGKGHRSRVIGDADVLAMVVQLPE